jgi:hypothetical protein
VPERKSNAVATASPGVRDKARCAKTREFGEFVTAVLAQRADGTSVRRRTQ